MISKIIVHGTDRKDVIQKTLDALYEFSLVGLKTTVPFCRSVLQHPDFIDATYTTRWVDSVFTPDMLENEDDEMIGALAATILYASEYLQLSSDLPTYKQDALNVWVLNKRLNY
jgi:acetyl/propionyl-CoA carboxylase alpha subunit